MQAKNLQDNSFITRGDFPDGFVFLESGTSGFQVEGAAVKGRYLSFMMIKSVFDAYRFFDFMARVLPGGRTFAGINKEGIDYYNDVINTVIANGMIPFVTLFHWDLPNCLQLEYGGMLSDQVVNDFVEFANLCFEEFGDRVKFWATINEPYTYAIHGYSPGTDFANNDSKIVQSSSLRNLPSHRLERVRRFESTTQTTRHTWFIVNDPAKETYTVARNLLLCHSRTVQLYRTNFQMHQNGQIGIVLSSGGHYPFDSSSQNDIDATQRAFDFMIGWFLEPVIYGQFPASMLQYAKGNVLPFQMRNNKGLLVQLTGLV
ncbi:UNVERIFIED_CONTAM: Raucaffricine-O-beta-D-glucosidase [Sesamum calycinum]|uniref:Raucaffricine-O-beta-D-glucosidase n=1 Tax=Sesamum calycinum TaxID=2727403 RepID=A0AAW2NFU4_9LAMI